jgi:cystathionine gamma-synthase
MYIRQDNPTQARLEEALAAADGGALALFFGSGMAAGAAVLQSLPAGAHLVMHKDVYFGFRAIAAAYFERWGLTCDLVDMTDLTAVRAALHPNTALLWAETPSNPMLEVLDITALAEIARAANARLLVDSTFAPPVIQRPLLLGADIVLHAATKYFGGHSDVQGGALIFREQNQSVEDAREARTLLGAVGSPFNAWLVLRGLRSLACRVAQHSANAQAIAEFLAGHARVERVLYPGLPHHPGHDIARRQMSGFGGMLSFQVVGGLAETLDVASRLRLFVNATSLGGVESLIEHRASVEGADSLAPPNLLRVSVGIEAVSDLIDDLAQALS